MKTNTEILKTKVENLVINLNQGLYEREELIRKSILVLLAGEHIFLLGTPGTGKSLLARRLAKIFSTGSYFDFLMTRYSTPEELFGPPSLKDLKEKGVLEYKTDSYLPKASIAFLDEIWKSNSSILNSLLTILNERKFRNGSRFEDVPLTNMICASNELPGKDDSLEAIWDRVLLRMIVEPIKDDTEFRNYLTTPGKDWKINANYTFSKDEVLNLQKAADAVELNEEVINLIKGLKKMFSDYNQGVTKSRIIFADRRWLKIVKILKLSAYINGRSKVSFIDCGILPDLLWCETEHREMIKEFLQSFIKSNPNSLISDLEKHQHEIAGIEHFMNDLKYKSRDGFKHITTIYHKELKAIENDIRKLSAQQVEYENECRDNVFGSSFLADFAMENFNVQKEELRKLQKDIEARFTDYKNKNQNLNAA